MELKVRNDLIEQLESRMDIEIESNSSNAMIVPSEETGERQNRIQKIMLERIDALEKQVAMYELAETSSMEKLRSNVDEKVRQMADEIERNRLLFIEEDSDNEECSSFTNSIAGSNSRGLYVMGLQKELNTTTESLREVTKAFAEFKSAKET